eukprot:1767866-Alexandrium_andersonii.AAC.1
MRGRCDMRDEGEQVDEVDEAITHRDVGFLQVDVQHDERLNQHLHEVCERSGRNAQTTQHGSVDIHMVAHA